MALGALEVLLLVSLLAPLLMVWALVDLLRRPDMAVSAASFNRIVLAIVIVFVGFIGPIAYLVFGRKTLDQHARTSVRNPPTHNYEPVGQ